VVGFALLGVVVWALVALIKLSIYLLMGAVIMEALLSWINPHSPIAPLLATISRPFVAPLRRHIPPLGNVDLTPFVLIIICQLMLYLPVGYLEIFVRHMLWNGRFQGPLRNVELVKGDQSRQKRVAVHGSKVLPQSLLSAST
jgi:uncharacterized protein YggT (Ycf19 family)